MGDDGVGIQVARMVQAKLQKPDIVVKEMSVSGIRLVEEMLDFDRAIIVDSHTEQNPEPGRIRRFTPSDFTDTIHSGTPHGVNFATALELYTKLEPRRIPKTIEIYTIDIDSELNVSDELSPAVERAGRELTDLVVRRVIQTDAT